MINVPKRGIGKTTIQRCTDAANQLGIPLWDVVSDPGRRHVPSVAARPVAVAVLRTDQRSQAANPRHTALGADPAGDGEERLCE